MHVTFTQSSNSIEATYQIINGVNCFWKYRQSYKRNDRSRITRCDYDTEHPITSCKKFSNFQEIKRLAVLIASVMTLNITFRENSHRPLI